MNVGEHVITGAKLFPTRAAIVFENQQLSYDQLDQLSSRAAGELAKRGIGRGDRVALLLSNVPAFVVWYYAALRLGAVAVSISTRLAEEEVAFIVSDCDAGALVTGEGVAAVVSEALPTGGEHVVTVSETGDLRDGAPLAAAEPLSGGALIDMEPHEPAVILYTSGTTGFPKGATLSHQNIRATVHAFNHLCQMNGDDRLLLAVPLFHCYGQNALLNSGLQVGATLVLQRRFDLNESKQLIATQRVTKLFGVPTTFQLLHESLTPAELESVKYCFSAAATLPIQISRRWQEKFGMPIYEGYGLTETAPFASYNHRLQHVPGSIGTPVDLVEMKIVDPDTGETCGADTPGEIAIRGPNVMLGYWNRPAETKAAIRDGWFFSGDIGRQDENGYFYIVDRLKDMIVVGGTKVFPAEVERVLLDHPTIAEAAVVGFPEAVLGEKVVAFLVARDGTADRDSVRQHCQTHLASYKVPRLVVWCDELPRNPAGKVLKTRLREIDLEAAGAQQWSKAAETATAEVSQQGEPATGDEYPRGLRNLLAEVHPARRQRVIESYLADELRQLIGNGQTPTADDRLVETGLDSLMIVELRDRLQQQVGPEPELPATLVFDHPRLSDLACFLLEAMERSAAPAEKRSGTTAATASGSTRRPPETADGDDDFSADRAAEDRVAALSEDDALRELLRELND